MLGDDELDALDAYWRAANYLTVGQIYLLANPYLGIALDAAGNAAGAPVISRGSCEVRVMRTDEEREIARATRRVLDGTGCGG